MLFAVRGRLFLGQRIAGLAINRVDPQHILTADVGNCSAQVSFARGPLAKFTRNFGRQFRVRRLAHQLQSLAGPLVGNQAQEGRLFELHRQTLP